MRTPLARAGPPPSSPLRGLGPVARDADTCGRAGGSGRWLIVCARLSARAERKLAGLRGPRLWPAALALFSRRRCTGQRGFVPACSLLYRLRSLQPRRSGILSRAPEVQPVNSSSFSTSGEKFSRAPGGCALEHSLRIFSKFLLDLQPGGEYLLLKVNLG